MSQSPSSRIFFSPVKAELQRFSNPNQSLRMTFQQVTHQAAGPALLFGVVACKQLSRALRATAID